MKSRFVNAICLCILSAGLFLASSKSLQATAIGTLRLNLDGPFVVCEETATLAGKPVPVLRILVPADPDHYNPGLSADSSWSNPPVADYELKAPGFYTLGMAHKVPGKVPTDSGQHIVLDSLPRTDKSCDPRKLIVFLSMTVPMPDRIRPAAPVQVDPNFSQPCDDAEFKGTPENYGTKLVLYYEDVDVDAIDLCPDGGTCFYPRIVLDHKNGEGVLTFHMLQKVDDPSNDVHYHAKQAHRLMRTIADAPNHCIHFKNDSGLVGMVGMSMRNSRVDLAPIILDNRYHGHSDCNAVQTFVCAKSSSLVCPP
jgi:hypothetical protein